MHRLGIRADFALYDVCSNLQRLLFLHQQATLGGDADYARYALGDDRLDDRMTHLSEHLCFLLYAGSREMTKLYRPLLEEHGLTYPQYLVLVVLHEQGPCTVKTLGERLYLDSGTLTPLLKRLEESGHLTRRRTPEDERSVVVTLTEQGQSVRCATAGVPRCIGEQTGMGDAQYTALLHDLGGFLDRLHQANQRI